MAFSDKGTRTFHKNCITGWFILAKIWILPEIQLKYRYWKKRRKTKIS
jgi:hypothetical protein